MRASDLANFLLGPTAGREMRDTIRLWRRVEATWGRSPLAAQSLHQLATALVEGAAADESHLPPTVLEALTLAAATLLAWEDIGQLDVDWRACREDPVSIVRLRHSLHRRQRWLAHHHESLAIFANTLRQIACLLAEHLPNGCIGETTGEAHFELALGDLVQDPSVLIEQLLLAPYDPLALSRGMFARARVALEANLRLASGLPPTADLGQHSRRLLLPARQRDVAPRDLANTYLRGTPLRQVFDTPVSLTIPESVRTEHMALVAGTGHGKTQCIQFLLHHDLQSARTDRRSVVLIDSQGDMINRVKRLRLLAPDEPGGLSDRLVLIDPEDVEHPPALNLFDAHIDRLASYNPAHRERVFNGLVEAYETLFADLLGAELTSKQSVVFRFLARLMLAIPGATIHTLMQIMRDGRPFRDHMAQLEGSAAHFFATEFFEPSFSATKKQILRRLWAVLSTPSFERMFAQPSNKLDLFQALQNGSIILINTAKDLLKSEGSQLFGRFFLKLIEQAALERATIDPAARTPTYVYVDEAQEYFDDSIETILRQARKFRVAIIVACQSLDGLPPRLRSALLTNTSIKCVGGLSAHEARAIAEELGTTPEFLANLRRRKGRSEFALWAKDQIPHAICLPVPLGYLEAQPIMTEDQYTQLIQLNRSRYCADPRDASHPRRGPLDRSRGSDVPPPHRIEEPETRGMTVRQPHRSQLPGKGGSQHKYLQHLIKQLAEERGLRAVIEDAAAGGQVDVGLHQADLSIACEISVTSTPEYEAQNLAKCFRAGFSRIWAIAPDAKRLRAIQQTAQARLAPEEFAAVEFMTTKEMVQALDGLTVPEPETMIVKGYRVKTTSKALSSNEAKDRRVSIARILAQSPAKR